MSDAANVRVERRDGLGQITLDRPPLNVVTTEMLLTLARAFAELGADDSLRVVVLTAAGEQFSAGVDIGDHTPERVPAMLAALQRCFDAIDNLPQPLVAAVDGAALGGGCEMVLAADLCFASTRSSFALPEIKLGHFAPPASVLLPRKIGSRRALDLLLTGRTVEAAEALQLGLVNALLPEADYPEALRNRLAQLLDRPGAALRLTKRAVREGCEGSCAEALRRVARLYGGELMRTRDAREGVEAFLARRAPRWQHR